MAAEDTLNEVLDILTENQRGRPVGIYSVCTAHPLALEAAMIQAKRDQRPLVVEATANQVNQFGGYTGMRPDDFLPFIARIADHAGLSLDRIVLGGDHLGPVCWTRDKSDAAMAKARDLVMRYVDAGFLKIHLDTSMACADDTEHPGDAIVAERAAELCEAAERAADARRMSARPVYVIGTEVPAPGGARDPVEKIAVTTPDRAKRTIDVHRTAFADRGLSGVWPRVIGLVVQPGVEFNHSSVHAYDPGSAGKLSQALNDLPGLVYEAHSTDYQRPESYRAMLRDHFAILKVGPQLTFAVREALFALSAIEAELLGESASSGLRAVCEQAMRHSPAQWMSHYPQQEPQARWYRRYSYSDRIRYYWNCPEVSEAVKQLFSNLSGTRIPLPLLSQYLPFQYQAVRRGELAPAPRDLVIYQALQVASRYSNACRGIA